MRRMIATPVSSSPAMIARSIGAAPRQRGKSDGWTFSISISSRSGGLMSCPNAQTIPRSIPEPEIAASDSGSFTLWV